MGRVYAYSLTANTFSFILGILIIFLKAVIFLN